MNMRQLINDLQGVTTQGKTLDELLVLAAIAQTVRTFTETSGVEVPEWLTDATRTLQARITELNNEILEARIRQIDQSDAALMTREEKRDQNAKARDRILQRLGRKVEEPVAQ